MGKIKILPISIRIWIRILRAFSGVLTRHRDRVHNQGSCHQRHHGFSFSVYIFQVIIIIMVVNAKFEISVGHFIERMGRDR